MPSTKFKKVTEDFICEHCGQKVQGDGYTNHCPFCLYSKHVDVHPGDRLETCGGLMKPIDVEMLSDGYIITHQCEKCGYIKKNKAAKVDNFEKMVEIIKDKRI